MCNESQSGGNPGEKLDGLQSDHRGISQARSSEGGNARERLPGVTIQSREPVDSNPVSVGAGEHGALEKRSVLTPRPAVMKCTCADFDGFVDCPVHI